MPWKHPRYLHFYVDGEPDIALTYPWSTSFREIKTYLDPRNIAMHNQATIDPNPSMWERLYLMGFLWVFFGPMQKIPVDIGERTIFVDILINDQTDVGAIAQELDKAEGFYKSAKDHVVVGSFGVLDRAWCLYEIAVRREAWKRSQVLLVRDVEADSSIQQVETSKVDVGGLLVIMYWRIVALVFSGWVLFPVFNVCCCLKIDKIIKGLSSNSYQAVENACDKKFLYYENMKAFKDSDKQGIQKKIDDVFGSSYSFNDVVGSATVQADSSRLSFSLLLWMEAIIICMSIPVHAASCIVGFLLGLIVMMTWRILSICNKKAHQQYIEFGEQREMEIQKFFMNVLQFTWIFEFGSCCIVIGILMMLPVSMILCSIWVCFKAPPSASGGEIEPPASGPSASGRDFVSGTLVLDTKIN